MTTVLVNGIKRTQECPDWTKHVRLRRVAENAFRHIPRTSIEFHINVECLLALVASQNPATFAAAKEQAEQAAYIHMRMRFEPVGSQDDTSSGKLPKKDKTPMRFDETAGRRAIIELANDERDMWRGLGKQYTQIELETMARASLRKAERRASLKRR